jgi:hypothetical protein
MLPRLDLVRIDVSEESIASIITVTRIGELGTTLSVLRSVLPFLVTANVVLISQIIFTLMMEAMHFSETSVHIRATWRKSQKAALYIGTAVKTSNIIYVFTII